MPAKPIDTRPFHLKPFSLKHHRSTMKVGTDAMLLGVWANVENVQTVLDIGTGCGIISLLIASRSNAEITAIDIDKDSVEEARENFQNSPFSEKMRAILADLNDFSKNSHLRYDLIVSNPPFFVNNLRPSDEKRKNARHTDTLSYEQLCAGASNLLKRKARFCVVLPYDVSLNFIKIAGVHGLFTKKQMLIFPREGMLPNRINIEFSKEPTTTIVTEKFAIRDSNDAFTAQYIELLSNYYLNLDS